MLERAPALQGARIVVRFEPALTAWRGKLLSGEERGTPVSAGSFPRRRVIVLEEALFATPGKLERILLHEVFHFTWVRLGNATRQSFAGLVQAELQQGVAGELGWSAERLKARVDPTDYQQNSRRWREYVCESFCDTAGWLYSRGTSYAERTLERKAREERRAWFDKEHRARGCWPV